MKIFIFIFEYFRKKVIWALEIWINKMKKVYQHNKKNGTFEYFWSKKSTGINELWASLEKKKTTS